MSLPGQPYRGRWACPVSGRRFLSPGLQFCFMFPNPALVLLQLPAGALRDARGSRQAFQLHCYPPQKAVSAQGGLRPVCPYFPSPESISLSCAPLLSWKCLSPGPLHYWDFLSLCLDLWSSLHTLFPCSVALPLLGSTSSVQLSALSCLSLFLGARLRKNLWFLPETGLS